MIIIRKKIKISHNARLEFTERSREFWIIFLGWLIEQNKIKTNLSTSKD